MSSMNNVKLSDYVANFLHTQGVDVVFGYQGSSVCHLIDSICAHPALCFVETRHEQAAAFAANAYAQTKQNIGVALSCSGPGATNLVTGIANAYYDSIPCLFLCGQVSANELRTNLKMRQLGFQEADVISLVQNITKYAVQITNPEQIAYELEKAIWYMKNGRPGPVLLDIPHNIQRSMVNEESMVHYVPTDIQNNEISEDAFEQIELCFNKSRRPVILLGGGCDVLHRLPALRRFLAELCVPIVVSYRGRDVWANEDENDCGVIGVYGNRAANWAIRYSDMVLSMGSRLDGRQTGGDMKSFAPDAKIFSVDIDSVEIAEKPDRITGVVASVEEMLTGLQMRGQMHPHERRWLDVVKKWQQRMPVEKEYEIPGLNPNCFMEQISTLAEKEAIFTVDVGQNQIWANTSLKLRPNMRLLQSCGLGSMGYALPAAVGAYYASPYKQVICLCGDGGFQMNLQEMQTIQLNNLPVKIFIFNNNSLGLIRIYQHKAMGGRLNGSVKGFGSPDYSLLARAYGCAYIRIDEYYTKDMLADLLQIPGPVLIEVCLSENSTCNPEPTYMNTVENQSPLLDEAAIEQLRKEAQSI